MNSKPGSRLQCSVMTSNFHRQRPLEETMSGRRFEAKTFPVTKSADQLRVIKRKKSGRSAWQARGLFPRQKTLPRVHIREPRVYIQRASYQYAGLVRRFLFSNSIFDISLRFVHGGAAQHKSSQLLADVESTTAYIFKTAGQTVLRGLCEIVRIWNNEYPVHNLLPFRYTSPCN